MVDISSKSQNGDSCYAFSVTTIICFCPNQKEWERKFKASQFNLLRKTFLKPDQSNFLPAGHFKHQLEIEIYQAGSWIFQHWDRSAVLATRSAIADQSAEMVRILATFKVYFIPVRNEHTVSVDLKCTWWYFKRMWKKYILYLSLSSAEPNRPHIFTWKPF